MCNPGSEQEKANFRHDEAATESNRCDDEPDQGCFSGCRSAFQKIKNQFKKLIEKLKPNLKRKTKNNTHLPESPASIPVPPEQPASPIESASPEQPASISVVAETIENVAQNEVAGDIIVEDIMTDEDSESEDEEGNRMPLLRVLQSDCNIGDMIMCENLMGEGKISVLPITANDLNDHYEVVPRVVPHHTDMLSTFRESYYRSDSEELESDETDTDLPPANLVRYHFPTPQSR